MGFYNTDEDTQPLVAPVEQAQNLMAPEGEQEIKAENDREADRLLNQLPAVSDEARGDLQQRIERAKATGDTAGLASLNTEVGKARDEEAKKFHEKLGGGMGKLIGMSMAIAGFDEAHMGLKQHQVQGGHAFPEGALFTTAMDTGIPNTVPFPEPSLNLGALRELPPLGKKPK